MATLAHGYALATCGRAGEALGVLERATAEARRRGLTRYAVAGREPGRVGAAQYRRRRRTRGRATQVALEGARETAYRELEVYATLDPCDDCDRGGDVAAATRAIEQARALMADVYAYRWRHELRVDLLEGRIALLRGDPGTALAIAERLIAARPTDTRRATRSSDEVLRLQARAALGRGTAVVGTRSPS